MDKKLLGMVIYNRIKNSIISGALPMGSKISESMLTEKLETTKAPVRDAIKRLSSELLVEVRPKSGTFVFKFTSEEFEEFLVYRFILELNALKIISNTCNLVFIEELSAIYDQMKFSLENNRIYDYVRLDNSYHQTIINNCGNRYIINSYESISARMAAVSNHLVCSSDHLNRGLEQHKVMINLLKSNDMKKLEATLMEHILPKHGSFWTHQNITTD